jgi:hypothetical protein
MFAPVLWMFNLITSVLRARTGVSPYSGGRHARIACACAATLSVAFFVSRFGNKLRSPSTFLLISFLHFRYYRSALVIYKIIRFFDNLTRAQVPGYANYCVRR